MKREASSGAAAGNDTSRFSIAFSGLNRQMFRFLGVGPSRSGITVTPDVVTIHMGWAFDATIPRSRITSATAAVKPRFFGWGVHGWCGRWVVNGSDHGIVRLTIDPPVHARTLIFAIKPHEIFVSLDDPAGFLRAIER